MGAKKLQSDSSFVPIGLHRKHMGGGRGEKQERKRWDMGDRRWEAGEEKDKR